VTDELNTSNGQMILTGGKYMHVEKTCSNVTLSSKNFTRDRVGIELGPLIKRPANNCQIHGKAFISAREKINC